MLCKSEFEVGEELFHQCTYESKLAFDNGCVFQLVLNPAFDWPYPSDANQILIDLLDSTEQRCAQMLTLGTSGVIEIQKGKLCALGEIAGYSDWGASEAELLQGWALDTMVSFVDEIRLIYSGHPIYHLDLVLEFDSSWNPTDAHFDG